MPGSGGGKTSSSSTSSTYAPVLAAMGMQMYRMAKPTMQTLSSQTAEGLQTGGVNARIPSINAALASARQGASTSFQNIKDQLAKAGLLNSSFGQGILAQEQAGTGQEIAGLPSSLTDQFLSRATPATLGIGTAAAGPLGTAAQLDTKSTSTPSFWDFMMQGMQAGATAATAAFA